MANPKGHTKSSKPAQKRNNNKRNKQRVINKAPVAKNVINKNKGPTINSGRNFTVTHREYLTDITSANPSYSAIGIAINPGLSGSFPWLSAIASRYESYIFNSLSYIYEPICPTTTSGSIMMAIDYDASDNTPSNKLSLMSYSGAMRSSPWDTFRFNAKQGDLRKFGIQRYVRSTANLGTQDIKTTDIGNLFVATQNTPDTETTLGELYVEYSITLFTPQINTGIVAASQTASQVGTLTLPLGTAIPTLTSIYNGSGNAPLFWFDPKTATSPNPTLLFNFDQMGSMLLGVTGQLNAVVDQVKKYSNTAFTTANAVSLWLASTGFRLSNLANDYERYFYIRPNGTTSRGTTGGGILPLVFTRPTNGNVNLGLSLIPINAWGNNQGQFNLPSINEEWSYPEINIPRFNTGGFSLSRGVYKDFSNDGKCINNITISDGLDDALVAPPQPNKPYLPLI